MPSVNSIRPAGRSDRRQGGVRLPHLDADGAVFFWGVVSDEINRVIKFLPTRRQAERMLAEAVQDEPDWRGILRVEKVEFRTETTN